MIRIGHAPRLPRRVLLGAGVFLIATAVSMDDGHLLAAGLIVAAMIANPWRSKKSRRRFVDAVLAACRGSVAGASSGPGAPPLRRPVASPRARAA